MNTIRVSFLNKYMIIFKVSTFLIKDKAYIFIKCLINYIFFISALMTMELPHPKILEYPLNLISIPLESIYHSFDCTLIDFSSLSIEYMRIIYLIIICII